MIKRELDTILSKKKCQRCGNKYMLKKLNIIYLSYPPKYEYKCPLCGAIDYYAD